MEQFQANEAAAMLVQSFRHDADLGQEVKMISNAEVRVDVSVVRSTLTPLPHSLCTMFN